jgi:hypothetical protein
MCVTRLPRLLSWWRHPPSDRRRCHPHQVIEVTPAPARWPSPLSFPPSHWSHPAPARSSKSAVLTGACVVANAAPLLERELNPRLVDAAVDMEFEYNNRSMNTSLEVLKQSTFCRSRILDWLEDPSMSRTKNVWGAPEGAAVASLGRGRCRGTGATKKNQSRI